MDASNSPRYTIDSARRLRQNQTSCEEVLWAFLRNRRLIGSKFRRQHPIGRYIADFYCHEHRLVVELEGSVHHRAEQMQYDDVRKTIMQQQGLKVLTFSNQEVFLDVESVLSRILAALTPTSP
jgi:very-short-patch-repair endonuclease